MKLLQFVLCALTYRASYQAVVKERILFGDEAVEAQIPYQVQLVTLLKHTFIDVNRTGSCGGSLISSRHVLTAQHCLVEYEWFPIAVAMAFGSIHSKEQELHNSLTQQGQLDENIQVCSDCWLLYPYYNPTYVWGDIAIINLPQAVEFTSTIQPVKLPSLSDRESEFIGKTALVAGWGITEHSDSSDALSFARFTISNNSECIQFMPESDTYYEIIGEICIKRTDNEAPSPCVGDSGSPLVVDNKQVGILSFANSMVCQLNTFHVYTSVIYFLPWISDKTGIVLDE